MRSAKSVGRITGLLLFVHLAAGLMLPYILLKPALAPPGFLANAAASSLQLQAAVLLLFMSGASTLAVAVTALPVFRRYSDRMALLLLALSAVSLALHAVENGTLLSMLSLSREYASSGSADATLFQALAVVVGSARKWAHFTHLLVVGTWIFALFTVLWRFALVPRPLAALGLLATLLQLTGVPLWALLGHRPVTEMAMPLAPIYLTVAVWLMAKGFEEPQRPTSHSTSASASGPDAAGGYNPRT